MQPPVAHVVYLHGFASSPRSSKAEHFERELRARGVGFVCPDLNEPEFQTLTVTRMLGQAASAIAAAPPGPVALIGSSLGAFVAIHSAVRDAASASPRVDRLVLLAPALDFGGNRLRQLGEYGIEEWKRLGAIRMFHYAHNESRDIGYALYEDAARYDAFSVDVTVPCLVYQGTRDALVDPAMVERWATGRPRVDLRLLDDEHKLTLSIDEIWAGARGFLGFAE
jgi:uncharacterized protein